MFLAAFTSALQVLPQAVQAKTAWLLRFSPATCPHIEQRWLVNAGFTGAPWPPPGLLLDSEIPQEPGVRTMAT